MPTLPQNQKADTHRSFPQTPVIELTDREKKSEALYILGYKLYASNLYERAAKVFQLAAFYDSSSVPAWISLGVCYLELKKYLLALVALTKASYHGPENPEVSFYLSHVFFELGQIDQADFFLEIALKKLDLLPKDHEAWRLKPYMEKLEKDFQIALEQKG